MHVVSPHLPMLWLHGQRASGLLLAFRAPKGSVSLPLSSSRHGLLLAACLAPQHAYPWRSLQLQRSKKCVFCDVPLYSSYSFSKIWLLFEGYSCKREGCFHVMADDKCVK